MSSTASSELTFHLFDLQAQPPKPAPVPKGMSRLAGCVLETVGQGRDASLLVTGPQPFQVNGRHNAHIHCLQDGDVVQLNGRTLQVALHVSSTIGKPSKEHAEKKCPICQGRVGDSGSDVYICAFCDAVMHCDRSEGGRNCVLGTECPVCRSPVMLEGYLNPPQELQT